MDNGNIATQNYAELLTAVVKIAKQAGDAILPYFNHPERIQARHKADNSPITAADLAAHNLLVQELKKLTPNLPILSEEGLIPDFEIRQNWQQYWLLDPLDGTRGFLRGSNEFSVNVALIYKQQPVIGVIYAPVTRFCYFAYQGGAAYRQQDSERPKQMNTRQLRWNHITLLIGQYHSSKRLPLLIEQFKHLQVIRLNSSLKFCRVAEGSGDIYPRYGPTGEWDTAAGQCILKTAGGLVVDLQGQPLHYNARDSLINPPFIAIGDPSQIERILHILPKPQSGGFEQS